MPVGATLTIQLEGSLDDDGHVRLDEFIEELGAIKAALKETERIVAGKSNVVYYRVVDLKHTSPASVRIEGVSPKREFQHVPRRVFRRFTTSLRMIQRRHVAPRDFDLQALEAFKNISTPMRKHMRRVVVIDDDKKRKAPVNQEYDDALRKIIGYDQKERGSMMGRLDALNVHLKNNSFTIYPVIGPPKITCKFRSDLRQKVLDYAGHYVRADGWVIYKSQGKFPHAMEVQDLEDFPPDKATKFSELRGLAPDATGGERSEDFIRRMRDGEW